MSDAMNEEILLQMLTDPAMADQLAQMSAYGDRQKLAQRGAAIGQGFMAAPGAEGRHVGNTYVASSPLEHAATAMQRVVGAKMVGDSNAAQQGLVSGDVATRQALARAMSDAMRRSRSGQAPPQPPQIPQIPQMLEGDFPQE